MTVEIEWHDRVVWDTLIADFDRTMGRGAMEGERVAKTLAAVDTGRMRAETHATRVGPLYWVLHNDVEYSIHQEFGWVYSEGRAFMRPGGAAGYAYMMTEYRRRYG
jgi:hypothetical protein